MIKSNRVVGKEEIGLLDLEKRIALESAITDNRSEQISLEEFDQRIERSLDEYVRKQPWRKVAFDWLGDLRGKIVLDICCGYSMTPVIMAMAGATVHAIDVAPLTMSAVDRFAVRRGVHKRIFTHVGPVETMTAPDNHFDLIFGGAALHHLKLDLAGPELARVLKPGGRAAFQEPLGHNLILDLARDYLPYRNRHPVKGTDKPLLVSEIQEFGKHFTHCHWQGFDLLTMLCKVIGVSQRSPLGIGLRKIDQGLFALAPYLQRYARFSVICVEKLGVGS